MNCTNLVIIEVSGGTAEVSHAHDDIQVYVIDWDSWNESGQCPWCHEIDEHPIDGAHNCPHCGFPNDSSQSMIDFISRQNEPWDGKDQPL